MSSVINFITLYLLTISISYSYACTSDELRELMVNSCSNLKKLTFELLKQQQIPLLGFDSTSCCDPDKIKMCRIIFCH